MKAKILGNLLLCCVIASAALIPSGCVRKSVTTDNRAIPSSDLGRWLPQGQSDPLPERLFTGLYIGEFLGGGLGVTPDTILYQAPLPDGQMETGAFDATGVIRFFRPGQVIWRFIRKGQMPKPELTASFGDDFTGGYVGKYKLMNGELYMHFYVGTSKSMTGFSFITIKAKLDGDKLSLLAVSRHRNGEFTDARTTILNPGVQMNHITVQGMQRAADW